VGKANIHIEHRYRMRDRAALGLNPYRMPKRLDANPINGYFACVFSTLYIGDRQVQVALIHEMSFRYGCKV
jgi:hypothetical protein